MMIIGLTRTHRVWLLLALLLVTARHACGQILQLDDLFTIPLRSQTLGKPPVTLDSWVQAMQFTADGKKLLTATEQITQIEWPSKKRRILWQPGKEECMIGATFSPDGTLFASSNQGDKMSVRETATGKLLHTFSGCIANCAATSWSPDGGRLVVAADHAVVIFDIKTGEVAQRIAFEQNSILTLKWSPDGRWIAAATENETNRGGPAFLCALDGKTAPLRLPGKDDFRFSFAPDSSILVVSCVGEGRSGIHGWDIASGKEIFHRECGSYNCITHSPDGTLLAAGGLSDILILDARTGREVSRQQGDSVNTHIWSLAFSPDGKILATGVEDIVRFRETTTWAEIDPDDALRVPVSALVFTHDGRHLVTGGWNGDLVLWDWEKKVPVWKRFAQSKAWQISSLSIDPTTQWIGATQHAYDQRSGAKPVWLIDFATGEKVRFPDVPGVAYAALLFHPTRRTAYFATRDHELVEWDCENGQILRKIPVPFLRASKSNLDGVINQLRFDPANPEIICWNSDGRASGRIHTGSGVEIFTSERSMPQSEADPIPPRDHEFGAFGSRVWNLPSFHDATPGEEPDSRPSMKHPSGLLQFSATGITYGRNGVRVFDILSQSFIHSFEFGYGEIHAIALSPDGRNLVVASNSGVHYRTLEGAPVAAGTTVETLWQLMGGNEHWQAYQAAWALARQPDYLRFLESQLAPAREPSPDEIARLKSLLADSDHKVRQTAARQWLDLGLELGRDTYKTLWDGAISEKWPDPPPSATDFLLASSGIYHDTSIPPLIPLSPHRRAMRAVMLLEADHSAASQLLLERLAGGHAEAPLTKAAKKALARQR